MSRSTIAVRLSAAAVLAASVAALSACSGTPTPAPASAAAPSRPPVAGATSPVPVVPASATPTRSASPSFDRSRYSLDDPRSIWVVVDKRRPLQPKDWIPTDLVTPDVPHTNVPQLRKPAAAALTTLIAAAKQDGVGVVSLSAYRSYATQTSIFERNLASMGEAKTLGLTAKPGYSEHQTGLADDLGDSSGRCPIEECFGGTAAGKWLDANSWRYGWILRYPKGYGEITGIQSEPWHFRYVGKDLATELHRTGTRTLEQFFGLPASPDYAG